MTVENGSPRLGSAAHPRRPPDVPFTREELPLSDTRTLRNFVGGKPVDASEGRTSDLVDPSTGKVFAHAPVSSAADVDAAMSAAESAFEGWRDSTPSERQKALI